MSRPVMHFELIASDPERLGRFYSDLFGWRAEAQPGMGYAMLRAGDGVGIDGGLGGVDAGLPPGLTIYVQVDDVDQELARARTLGAGEILQSPHDVPGVGRFAVVRDPEGNRVGLWTMPSA